MLTCTWVSYSLQQSLMGDPMADIFQINHKTYVKRLRDFLGELDII